jgi:CRP/FNR family transcriptional regulator, cyclic AMP receptor protein
MIFPQEMDKIPFLRDLGGTYSNELARMAQLQERPAGAVIFQRGQDSSVIYFVLDGEVGLEVQVSAKEIAEVHRVGPGDLLGWSPLLGRRSMTATARAVTPTRLAVLSVDQITQMCERDPLFGTAFHRQMAIVLSSRLDNTHRQLAHHLARRPIPAEGSD